MSVETLVVGFWLDAANGIEPSEGYIYPESRFHWRRHKEQIIKGMIEFTGTDPKELQCFTSFETDPEYHATFLIFPRTEVEVGRVELEAMFVPVMYEKGKYFIDSRHIKGI